jgi:hypothetical protein
MARPSKKAKTTATTTTAATPSKRNKSPNFHTLEEVWLSKAFANNSLNPVAGVGKKSDQFWNNVKKDFDVMKATGMAQGVDEYFPTEERIVSALRNKWKTIQGEVSKFLQVKHATPEGSGDNKESYMAKLLELFNMKFGSAFRFSDCVEHLEELPKFSKLKDGTMVEGMELEEGTGVQTVVYDLERPEGAKKAMRKGKLEDVVQKMDSKADRRATAVITELKELRKGMQELKDLRNNMKRAKMVEVLMTDRAYQLQRGNVEMADSISDTISSIQSQLVDELRREMNEEPAAVAAAAASPVDPFVEEVEDSDSDSSSY